MKGKARLTYLVLFSAVCFSGCARSTLTEQQIIDIATDNAQAEGISLDIRVVCYDAGNEAWASKLMAIKKNSPDYAKSRNYFKVLDNYDYQAVLFAIKPDLNVLGGDFWVFVDRQTGGVITTHGEK